MKKFFTNLLGPSKLLWLARQVLQFGGLWLVATGRAEQDEVTQATEAIWNLIGSISLLIGFAGNIYSSFRNSATVAGEKVDLNRLPPEVKQEVKVEAKKAVTLEPNIFEKIFSPLRR